MVIYLRKRRMNLNRPVGGARMELLEIQAKMEEAAQAVATLVRLI